MKKIDEIRKVNAERGSLIQKAFNQASPDKYFDQLEKGNMTEEEAFEVIEKAFQEGKISEETFEKAKYIRRTGSKGNYKYEYKEKDGNGKVWKKEQHNKEKFDLPKVGQSVNIEGKGEMEVRAVRNNEIVLGKKGEERASLSMSHDRFKKLSGGGKKEEKEGGEKNEGKKLFSTNPQIGKVKYSINVYDGKSTHKDGSPFIGIKTFKNKKDYELSLRDLKNQGYNSSSNILNDIKKEKEGGKSKNASKVLQLMDQDYSYQEALSKVIKETGVDKKTLEKELNKYI